jgi:hypothetical protein
LIEADSEYWAPNHVSHDRIISVDPENPDRALGTVLSHAEVPLPRRISTRKRTAGAFGNAYRRSCTTSWRRNARRCLGDATALRNRAYDSPQAADWQELGTWKEYYG